MCPVRSVTHVAGRTLVEVHPVNLPPHNTASPHPGVRLGRSVGVLVLGSVGAQLVSAMTLLICLPQYGFAAFGSVATYLLVSHAISHVAILKSCNVLLRVQLEVQKDRVVATGVIAAAVVGATTTAITLALCNYAMIEPTAVWMWLGPSVFMGGLYDLMSAVQLRASRPKIVAFSRVAVVLAIGTVQILMSFLDPSVGSIALSYFCGYLIGALCLMDWASIWGALRQFGRSGFGVFEPSPMDATVGVGISLVETLGQYGLPSVIQLSLGANIAGCYLTAARFVQTPVQIVMNAHGQALQAWVPSSSSAAVDRYLHKVVGVWGLICLGVAACLSPVVSAAVSQIFGEQWSDAGTIAAALMLACPVLMMQRSVEVVAIARHRLAYVLAGRLISLTACVVPIVFAGTHVSVTSAVVQSITLMALSSVVVSLALATKLQLLLEKRRLPDWLPALGAVCLLGMECIASTMSPDMLVGKTTWCLLVGLICVTVGVTSLLKGGGSRSESLALERSDRA